MLTKEQMGMVDHIFKRMKDMLFAVGEVPQAYCVTKGNDAIMFPMPFEVSSSVGLEIAQKFSEMPDAELVCFISEVWGVKRVADKEELSKITDENWKDKAQELLGKGSPKEQPDSSEALMMVVMEVATQKVHMKLGAIKRDSEGGPYVDEDEWMPDGDVSNLKTSFMPTFNA